MSVPRNEDGVQHDSTRRPEATGGWVGVGDSGVATRPGLCPFGRP